MLGPAVVAWFDAQTASTISLSGSSVTSWLSRVGSVAAIQATAGAQPTFNLTAQNGLPGVTFDGVNDVLQLNATAALPVGDSDGFMCAVGYVPNGTGGYRYMMSYGNTGISSLASRSIAEMSTSNVGIVVFGSTDDTDSGVIWPSASRFAVAQFGSGQTSLTVDGQLTPQLHNVVLATSSPGAAMLGAYSGGNSNWQGVIQEALIGNRKLTNAERQQMEGYLAWRWGLASQLPPGHPYKLSAP